MEVTLEVVSKRYSRQWIIKDLSYTISPGARLALTGHNGSGKSTLLKIIAGALPPSRGKVIYRVDDLNTPVEKIYRHIVIAAPYNKLIEEFTIVEAFDFHASFKPLYPEIESVRDFIEILGYPFRKDVPIKNYSSGMKQRLQLGLCICSQSELILLDEPGSNLDASGATWLRYTLEKYLDNRTLVIASNMEQDFALCKDRLDLPGLVSVGA